MAADRIDNDTDTLARTIYGEARGESLTGMQAIACVVGNRCAIAEKFFNEHGKPHPLFGDGSPASACGVKFQFSCWDKGDPNLDVITGVTTANTIFGQCVKIAQDAIAGNLDDSQLTLGATHYYDRRMAEAPEWAEGKSPCVTIGHHLFFNNID